MLNLLPDVTATGFVEAQTIQLNDQHMCVWLGSLIRTIIALHNLIGNKVEINYIFSNLLTWFKV